MASHRRLTILAVVILVVVAAAMIPAAESACNYSAIFVFGDSLSDTGNCYYSGNLLFCGRTAEYPYGETFPGTPFKRFSDGRLIVDFITNFLNLGLLNPYLNILSNFSNGVNYAVSGATANDVTTLLLQYGIVPITPLSLDIQLFWHTTLKSFVDFNSALGITYPDKPKPSAFTKGLYILEIGGNDYINAFNANVSISTINTTLVTQVIGKIRNATQVLYNNGARNFLYFSITPLGCSPSVLANINGAKDQYGCLVAQNSVSENHGNRLRNEVNNLRATYPDATFSFLNYYDAYEYILRNKTAFGFTNTLSPCCGGGNPNNPLFFCNQLIATLNPSAYLCSTPNTYLNWDGIHFTDAFNAQISNQTIGNGAYLEPPTALKTYCSL